MGDGDSNSTVGTAQGVFPRICELINIQDEIAKPAGTTLEAIATRMASPLDALWKRGETLGQWDKKWCIVDTPNKPLPRPSLEEQWARAISELLTGTAYDGPEVEAKIKRADLYQQFKADNPCIAIANPCETLSTYLVLSRGYPMADLISPSKMGLDSGNNGDLPVFKNNGGQWKAQGSREFPTAIKAQALQPGSCYGWLEIQESEKDGKIIRTKVVGSHVAGMLRVDESGGTGQLLDTGAAQDRLKPGEEPFSVTGENWGGRGSYDNAASISVKEKIVEAPYQGLGTPATLSDADLEAAIAQLRKARPFGLARLFVAQDSLKEFEKALPEDRKKAVKDGQLTEEQLTPGGRKTVVPSKLLFMSKLCRMWGTADQANYSIMRCQWALRSLPEWSKPQSPVIAWWVFYSPVAELATALLKAGRGASLADVQLSDKRNNAVARSKAKHLSQPLLIIRSLPDGRTKWAYVRRALEPSILGAFPAWMKEMLNASDFDSVHNPHGVPIPAELNDGVPPTPPAAPAPPAPTPSAGAPTPGSPSP